MKILYISNRTESNIGANLHFEALKEIAGNDSIIKVSLRADIIAERTAHYVAYGKYRSVLHRIGRWIQGNSMYISDSIIRDLCGLIMREQIDIVFLEENYLGKLIKAIKRTSSNVKVICFFHDIGADLYRQWRKNTNWVGKIENTINLKQEKLTITYADIKVVFHDEDDQRLARYYKTRAERIIPLSTKHPKNAKANVCLTKDTEKKSILFMGSSYYPNIVGIKWFYDNVLPSLENSFELMIIGRGTECLRNDFVDERIQVIGAVDTLDTYYQNADVVIAPIFDGGGMKMKTVEAISFGKCFIGTTNSLAGFWNQLDTSVRDKVVFKCDTADEWISTINKLLISDINKFNESLYSIFTDKFSFDSTKESIRELLLEGENK